MSKLDDLTIERLYEMYWHGGDCAATREAFIAGMESIIERLSESYADQPATYEEAQAAPQHKDHIHGLLLSEVTSSEWAKKLWPKLPGREP